MKSHLLTLCAALLLFPTTALAAPAKAKSAPQNEEGAAIGEQGGVQTLTFGIDENVEGEVLLPNGVDIGGRIAKEHASMIGIRGQFTNQLIWLSNDI
jgi:hypothetical protein